MLVSTKGRYALRVMIDLSEQNPEEYRPLKDIAQRQNISEKYLENILPVLVRNDFIIGVRGKGGGYKLTRSPETYTVGSVVSLVENVATIACLGRDTKPCDRSADCRTLPMWQDLQNKIEAYLNSVTIADLCRSEVSGYDFVI